MSNDLLQEISDFFSWYKTIYGPEISIEGEFNSAVNTYPAVEKAEIPAPKEQYSDTAVTLKTFDEQLVHHHAQ